MTETLAEHGFKSGDVDVGMYHGAGHGVGVSLHESPSLSGEEQLEIGHAITVESGVYDPDRGGVRLEDLVVIMSKGYEKLMAYPREMQLGSERDDRE